MKSPYSTAELDALLGACVEYTDQHGQYFATGNIAGRGTVRPEIEPVRRMLDWVAETDRGVLEYAGLGMDMVPYFRLGHDARQLVSEGGFRHYFRRRTTKRNLELARNWVPILISLVALVVSMLPTRAPEVQQSIDAVANRVSALEAHQVNVSSAVSVIQSRIDTLAARRVQPPSIRR